jgi:hypothetical protein
MDSVTLPARTRLRPRSGDDAYGTIDYALAALAPTRLMVMRTMKASKKRAAARRSL